MNKKALTGFLKRQTFVIYLSLLVIVLGTSAISYALFSVTKYSEKDQVVQTGTFNVSYEKGDTIAEDVFVLSDEDGMNTDSYTFTVSNSGSIQASYVVLLGKTAGVSGTFVGDSYFRYSLDNAPAKSLSTQSTYNNSGMYILETMTLNSGASKEHKLKVWLSSTTPNTELGKIVNLSIQVVAVPTDPAQGGGQQFIYTGQEEIFIVPYTGTYTIEAAGAQGAIGNLCSTEEDGSEGGKGAVIQSEFNLNAGDKLHLIVGGKGTNDTTNCDENTTGAGGGGSFIFKEIPTITDDKYQFVKGSTNYDVLLVAAGGSGTTTENASSNIDGISEGYKSPSNYSAYSSISIDPTSTSNNSNFALGIKQYIDYDLLGNKSVENGNICQGAYGGGGCSNQEFSPGGGWSATYDYDTIASSPKPSVYSWSSGNNTLASATKTNEGNGYIKITLKS